MEEPLIIYDQEQAIVRYLPRKFRRNRDEHHGVPDAVEVLYAHL